MRLTGALGGTERWLQSFIEPQGLNYEGLSYLEKRKAKKAMKDKGIRDYLHEFSGGGNNNQTYI